jgi:hypothetical protein
MLPSSHSQVKMIVMMKDGYDNDGYDVGGDDARHYILMIIINHPLSIICYCYDYLIDNDLQNLEMSKSLKDMKQV